MKTARKAEEAIKMKKEKIGDFAEQKSDLIDGL